MGLHSSSRRLAASAAVAIVAVALAACSGASATSATPSAAPALTGAAAGQVMFQQSCESCHGVGGVGSKFTKDNNTIEVPSIVFKDLSDTYGDKYDTLVLDGIVKGLDETGQPLNRMMPRWTIFSDAQLGDIVTYLKTLK